MAKKKKAATTGGTGYNDEKARESQSAIFDAFEEMSRTILPGFESESSIPEISGEQKIGTLPLYGFYGEQFYAATPSQELLEKEQKRIYGQENAEDQISIIEQGLCAKYGIVPPPKWPNRRKDRGEGGEQLLILGQTVNDRRHPKLWGIRQEDRTRHAYVIGGSGSGKSLPWLTPVLTWDDNAKTSYFKPIGELQIGDFVYTRNGYPAKVNKILDFDSLDVWELELDDGQIIECSGDHNWIVERESHGQYREYVKTTEQLYQEGICRSHGEQDSMSFRNAIPLCEPVDFPEVELPIPPYALGLLLGDGYICSNTNSVQLSTADPEIIDQFLSVFPDTYSAIPRKDANKYGWLIADSSDGNTYKTAPQLKRELRNLGLCIKAHKKFIPEIYKFASVNQRVELLRGLCDSDGSASTGRMSFFTTSEKLLRDTLDLVRSLGIKASYSIDKRSYKNAECGYQVSIQTNNVDLVFALSRKKDDYHQYAESRSQNTQVVFKHNAPELLEEERTPQTLPIHPYLLGVLMKFSLSRSEIFSSRVLAPDIMELCSSFAPNIEFSYREYENKNGIAPLVRVLPYIDGGRQSNGKRKNVILHLCRTLGFQGAVGKRRIPPEYLSASVESRQLLLQGICDTYAILDGRFATLSSNGIEQLSDIEALAKSLGYEVDMVRQNSIGTYAIRIAIADDSMFLSQVRRKSVASLVVSNCGYREERRKSNAIVDIRRTDRKARMRCISVDDDSESFLIEGYVVTHNSTLLHALGVEDMWYWRGGLLMEPHGDLALGLLRTAPPYRIHDIVYLNVLDPLASPGFNPLELPMDATDEERAEATGTVTTLISKHFHMSDEAVLMRKMLTNAINALSYVPGATLLEVMDFYNNEDIRNAVLAWVPDGPQKDAMADLAMNAKTDQLGSLENRISRFTTNRFMKHLFGQSHTTLNFYDLMNQGYYIICPVSKGGTSDDTFLKFYGSYIVSEVYKASVMREAIEEGDRVNFALTLDEFQNFISDDIEGILSEARKYGLMMMLANQYLDQLTPTIKAAVLQNCATKLVYNLGPRDAPEFAKAFGYGLKAEDLQSIPKYHVMAAPLIRGGNVRPFISAVFPPISLKSEVASITADLIAENSRNRFMTPRGEIDAEISERKERLASGNKEAIVELVTKKNR